MTRPSANSCTAWPDASIPRSGMARPKSLIVVAPPRALGVLRQAYTASVRGAVRDEIDKDLVKVPVYEIEKRLFS